MIKLYSKFLFIIVIILSLTLHIGCSMYINESGYIIIDWDRENDKGNNENKDVSYSDKDSDELGILPDSISPMFSLNSYITQEKTVVETEHFKLEIDKNEK